MKILQVIPFFSPKFGGSVTVLYQLSIELAKKGHDVTIITSDFGFDIQYAKDIETYRVHVVRFQMVVNFGLFIYTPSIRPWLKNNIKNFDVIHMHNFRSYQNNCVAGFALKNKIPYIIQAHGTVLPDFEKRGLKKLYDIFWGYQLIKNASGFIAVTQTEKIQYYSMGIPENKIEIIPNGIDVSEYETLPERGKFRKKYGIAPDEKVILFLGRLHACKGIDFLIDGFSSLTGQYKNAKLVIAGPDEGSLETLIQQVKKLKIADKVVFPGPLYKNEKSEALVDADVVVCPGRIEIFGLVPFEAIICGTTVIVTDDCGCGEIIKEKQCGNLVKYGDIPGLTIKIKEMLTNSDEAREKVNLGRQYIKECLSWEINILKFEELYANCLRNR